MVNGFILCQSKILLLSTGLPLGATETVICLRLFEHGISSISTCKAQAFSGLPIAIIVSGNCLPSFLSSQSSVYLESVLAPKCIVM